MSAQKQLDVDAEYCVPVASVNDIVTARLQGRALAERLGFSTGEATLVATAISELARNIVQYAGNGDIVLRAATNGTKRGVVVVARDHGPGISDLKLAVRSGYSTSGGLGLGLPGVRRIVDDFQIVSNRQDGTTVTVTKWRS
jgi:serine/threonine-protein kinase RsbT